MSESAQSVLALLVIVGMVGSFSVFMNDRANWTAISGLLTLMFGSLGVLIWSLYRRDKAPDFMKNVPARMFERNGFCFGFLASAVKSRSYLDLHFQSHYARLGRGSGNTVFNSDACP